MNKSRWLGQALLWAGFLAGAVLVVRSAEVPGDKWSTIDWPWYGAALLVGVAGVVVLRATKKGAGMRSQELDADLETLERSLENLVRKLAELEATRDKLAVFDVLERIDAELVEDLGEFVRAREAMIHRYGLQQYANVMSEFAAGERSINRAWSASADGYIDEVWLCVERARHHMAAAAELLASY